MISERIRRFFRACALMLAAGCIVPTAAADAEPGPLAGKTPGTPLRVVVDNNYPPFLFIAADGKADGFVVDYWRLWQQKTGVPVELLPLAWAEAQRRLLAGEADAIDLIFRTPQREASYEFSAAYADVPVAIYSHASLVGIADVSGLRGFQIGVMAGDACIDVLRLQDVTDLREYPSYTALIEAAMAEDVKIFCLDEHPANYYFYRKNAQKLFRKDFQLYEGQFHRAVKKGNADTLALIERGNALISETELAALREKWMPPPVVDYAELGRWLAWAGGALALLVIVIAAWIRSMRAVVARQTLQLRESETRFRKLFEDTRQPVTLMKDGLFVAANRSALETLGMTDPTQLLGRTPVDISPARQPDGESSADKAAALIVQTLHEGSAHFEWNLQRANGEEFTADVLATAIRQSEGDLLHLAWADISGRKRMERELAEHRHNLEALVDKRTAELVLASQEQQALFDAATAGIVFVRDRLILRCNRALEQIFGYAPGELIGQSTRCWYADEATFADTGRRIAEAQAGGRHFAEEIEMVRKDGSRFWARVTAQAIHGGDIGAGVAGMIEDITEERVAAEALRQTSQEQAAILDAASAGIVLVRDRIVVRCNRRADELLGYEPGEQIGQSARIWFANEGDFEAIGNAGYPMIWRGETYVGEWLFRRKDGSVLWIREVAHAVDARDPTLGIVVILEDITAERNASEALSRAYGEQEAIFESATSGIVLIKDRILQRCNRRLHEMFGWPPGEMVGKPTRIWYADEDGWQTGGGEVYEQIWRGETHRREQQLMRRDGSLFWARLTARAVDVRDHERGSVWVIDDISVERAAIDEMLRAKTLAEAAAKAKADFLANMSHEIRTPMNAIIGITHLVLMTELNARQQDYLRKIQGSSQHLLGIINDILDFSKIEAGKMAVERIDFELERTLDGVVGLVAEKASSKGLELILNVAVEVPTVLVGDPLRLGQILANLANNAVKFTEQGEIEIAVGLDKIVGDELQLRFSVRDTGVGLSAEQCGNLFQSFTQADTSTTRKYGGTGLGLVISKRLAELMGGEIGVHSEVGHGSTFWFTVRVGRGQENPARLLPRPDLRGRRILVADDNEHARLAIGEMLRSMTFAVDTVATGAEALAAVARADAAGAAYDVLLLDWQMPGVDGIETQRRLGEMALRQPPRTAMITAYGRDELVPLARAVGIEDILVKPVTSSLLFDTLMHLLGGTHEPASAKSSPTPPVLEELGTLAGARIMLVEDNELNQEVASELLRQAGFLVDIAGDGSVALRMAGEREYDLVFMDMQMPVMDGLEATRELRRRGFRLPIVAMTANAMSGDRERCLEAGMDDHVPKPIDPAQLWATLRRWLKASGRAVPAPALPSEVEEAGEADVDGLPAGLPFIPGLDMRAGLRQSLGRESLYRSLLRKYADSQRQFPAMLMQSLANSDWATAARLVHTLKGVSAQIGADGMRAQAEALELRIAARAPLPELRAQLDVLAADLARLTGNIDACPLTPAAATQAGEVDTGALAEVCSQLATLLAADDFAASRLFDEHAALLQPALGANFAWIAEAIQDFNYAAALDWLKEAAAARGLKIEP